MSARALAARTAELLRAADARGLNATLHWSEAHLEVEAARLEAAGPGVLGGMPVAVKDNIVTLDLPTTCASRILEGFVSPFEATAVRRLRQAGAMIAA